jgi:hypothetical protein
MATPPRLVRSYDLPDGDRLVEKEWATAAGLELDGEGRFKLSDGNWIEPRSFTVLDAAGRSKMVHGHPRSSALDDYLYVTGVHYVRDGKLYCAMIEVGGRTSVFKARLSMERLVRDELVLTE